MQHAHDSMYTALNMTLHMALNMALNMALYMAAVALNYEPGQDG